MRCPLCGADNANNQLTCWSCGAWLPTRRVEDQVDQLMERLSAAATEQAERESLFMHAFDMVDEVQPDNSWIEDAEARLLASRNAGDTTSMRVDSVTARLAAAAEARRLRDIEARAAAFVSQAYDAIDFPPVGAVESPRSDPATGGTHARRHGAHGGKGASRDAASGATGSQQRAHRKHGRGPRFKKSVVPVVAQDESPRPRRRAAEPAEPELPDYAAQTTLETDRSAARVVPSEAGRPSDAGAPRQAKRAAEQPRVQAEPPFQPQAAADAPTFADEDAYAPSLARSHDRAEHPFGEAQNILVEDSLFEAFPEGIFDDTALESWDAYPEEELSETGDLGERASSHAHATVVEVPDAWEEPVAEPLDADGASPDGTMRDAVPSDEELPEDAAIDADAYEVVYEQPSEDESVPTPVPEPASEQDEVSLTEGIVEPVDPVDPTDEGILPEDSSAEPFEGEGEPLPEEPADLAGEPGEPTEDASAVEQTVQRPAAVGIQEPLNNGGHFVVRNTRDYDHDAQSTNLVNAGDQFDTLTESRDARKLRNDPYARSKRRGYVPGEGNSNGLLRPFLAVLLVALVLCGGGAVLTYGLELWGGKSVPIVTGYQQAAAEQKLSQEGFVAVVEPVPADDAIGVVTSQIPEAGSRLPEGSEVVLRVATNRTVPNVMGLSEADARTVLEKSGAENIVSVVEPSTEAEGTVIAVDPGVGEPFVSRVELKITIAGPYIVPDVLTKKEQDAIEALEAAGFVANVTYVNSDQTVRTVVETIPAAGTAYEKGGTVEVHVSAPYPSDPYHLAEFFEHSSQDDNDYLLKQGFSFEGGAIEKGQAQVVYTSSDKGNLAFSSTPHAHQLKVTKKDEANALASGTPFSGVRIDLPAWLSPGGYDESSLMQVADTCGFSGLTDSCTNATLTLPSGVTRLTTVEFGCISGRMDDLVWTVLMVSDGSSLRISATCAKEGVYASSDLAGFGGNVSQYAAYQEVYASKEYEPKPDPKAEEGKDGEKKEGAGTEGADAANTGEAGA